ncbi:MAG: DUF1573 domain-containing protein [Bacteroidaceae bacterium]|nr:DUF1573 domain-containing protein [Bacteroidaceae bacterium]
MKKTIFFILCALLSFTAKADDPKRAEIKFERTTIDLGKFGRETPIRKCAFVFTNTGDADLYIHQIFTSCRCTGKEFPTHAIKPGAQDSIIVIFNGEKSAPRKFRTSVTIHSNAKTEMTKVYIKGEMLPAKVQEVEIIEVDE